MARAHHLVPAHKLNCSDNFPCAESLKGRTNFWIATFTLWGKRDAIFHNPDVPEMVYSVVDTRDGCSRRVSKTIKKERKRIKTALYNVAAKVESGARINVADEVHLLNLFRDRSSKKMRRAAENIRCQTGVRDSFVEGLKRFNRYNYMVDTILAQHQLPLEIRYLPFVESSYNPAAYSKAGAAGMWQIMPRTARTLGLELNATVDERLDPEASTRAAARYLVRARASLTEHARTFDPSISDEEINPFVITSYNYGLTGMRKAISKIEPDYMSVLNQYKSPRFQVAVKNFYASFLAAQHVATNSQKFFGNVVQAKKLRHETYVLQHETSMQRLTDVFNLSESDLKPYNLGLTRYVWNGWRMISAGYRLNLPHRNAGYEREIAFLESLPAEKEMPGADNYIVRKGDTACGIARGLNVNCRELIRLNNLGKRALIHIEQELLIPRKLVVVNQADSKNPDKKSLAAVSGSGTSYVYRVRRGDTACKIADQFGVSCRKLISENRLGRKATIYVGQQLRIPGQISQAGLVAGLDENSMYLVHKGDFACGIADRFAVSCVELRKINELNLKATIYPGQKLKIPGFEAQETTKTVEQLAQLEETISEVKQQQQNGQLVKRESLTNLLDTLPDLSISITGSSGQPVYRIWVEADETLGHYSDWLGLSTTKSIRDLNSIAFRTVLQIGRALKLPIKLGTEVANFEQKRKEYHQVLNEALKEHYIIAGIEKYTIRRGDSVWQMSNESGFPMWLFYRLNPQFKITSLQEGQQILLPKLIEKSS
jgi:membrane-bound lytic murein transglycosylase D